MEVVLPAPGKQPPIVPVWNVTEDMANDYLGFADIIRLDTSLRLYTKRD
jgi:hypothetical protein